MENLTVDLNILPREILSKIPYSIRVSKSKYKISELPLEVQYLVNKYIENADLDIIYNDNVYDFLPFTSEYNDLEAIKDRKKLIVDYLKNYLSIMTGSYPFDIHFGCELKLQLQTKDTSLRQTLISNELSLILGILSSDYNIKITGRSLTFNRNQLTDKTEYSAELVVEIENDEYLISVI